MHRAIGLLGRGGRFARAPTVEGVFFHPSMRLMGFLIGRVAFRQAGSQAVHPIAINNAESFERLLQRSWFSYRFHRSAKFFSYATTSPSIFPVPADAHVRARPVLHACERPGARGAAAGGVSSIPRDI